MGHRIVLFMLAAVVLISYLVFFLGKEIVVYHQHYQEFMTMVAQSAGESIEVYYIKIGILAILSIGLGLAAGYAKNG